jgi:hypothetical protein
MAIKQPKNVTITQGGASMKLVWGKSFAVDRNHSFSDVQKFVDSESIRLMVPYTPMRNGILQKGAVLGTKIGSGEIHYNIPYARYQYYYPPTRTEVNPNATMEWFETAKAAHLDEWVRLYANLYTGGGTP